MIEPHQAQNCSVQIRHMAPILHRPKSQFIGRPVNDATFDATTGQPGAETLGMMIAASPFRAG